MFLKEKLFLKINQIVGVTLIFICQVNLPGMAGELEEKQLWQAKSQLVIDHLSENYVIPAKGDRGKYVMPALIAYRWRNPKADWQPQQWQQLQLLTQKKPEDFYTNSDAFNAPGITRLLYLYPQDRDLKKVEQEYFQYLFPSVEPDSKYNFWQSGGTENFVNMLRTSGYLLAQKAVPLKLPQASQKLAQKEKWLRYKAHKTYQMGVSEWDSSSYTIFNLIGWLNVYDFAENPAIKAIAKAVLDYYASAIALKYTYGVYGGAEQRGGSAIGSFESYTDYLGWFWFSDYLPSDSNFFKWPQYIQLIHPATSSYRPPIEAIQLARKKQVSSSLYQNSKANYGLARLEIPELFFIGKTYTLGTALVTKGEQIVNWKLVSYPKESEQALVVTGSNSYLEHNEKKGTGKTIFDRYLQEKNILVQMTYVPPEVKSQLGKQGFRQFMVNLINKIPCGNTCTYWLSSKVNQLIPPVTYPVEKQNKQYFVANYLSFPANTSITNHQGVYFVQLNDTYLAIFPFPQQSNLQPQIADNRVYLEVTAPLDQLTGFVVEVGNKLDHQSFRQFQNFIVQNSQLDFKQLEWEKVRYKTSDRRQLYIDYGKFQAQANLKVNNQPVNLQPLYLYQGQNLQVKNKVLRLESDNSVYQVNFQKDIPIFSQESK